MCMQRVPRSVHSSAAAVGGSGTRGAGALRDFELNIPASPVSGDPLAESVRPRARCARVTLHVLYTRALITVHCTTYCTVYSITINEN